MRAEYDFSKAERNRYMSDDNWIHRSKGMRCETCMYYVFKRGDHIEEGEPSRLGRCRRHAPTMNGWPVLFPADWCGDHKLSENKV